MTKALTGHQVNPANMAITIEAGDLDPRTGATNDYMLSVQPQADASAPKDTPAPEAVVTLLAFQYGAPAQAGFNGLTDQALLAVLIDRMEGFEAGKYAVPETGFALDCLRTAQMWMNSRTGARIARGVDGTVSV